MRALAIAVALVLALPALALGADTVPTLPDIEDEVMCVACGTALNISQAPSADGERAFIERRIAEGLTKEEIKAALVAEYGPRVLAEPRQTTAWVIPVVLGLAALLGVGLTLRRWRDAGAAQPASAPAGPALRAEDAQRLERDMAGYDK